MKIWKQKLKMYEQGKTVINDQLILEEDYDENYQPSEEGMSYLYYWLLSYNIFDFL